MAQNQVMKLWNVIVTAFLALCTTLGLITTATAAAVPQPEATGNRATQVVMPTVSHWSACYARALPPTMKQRIRAEAHGKSPSCRQRPLDETQTDPEAAEPAAPLQP